MALTVRLAQRSTPLFAVAAIVPLLVFGILQLARETQSRSNQAADDALGRSGAINAQVDAAILADQAALSVLASSPQFEESLESAFKRITTVIGQRPSWRNVLLTDLTTKTVVWDARNRATGQERPSISNYINEGMARPIGGISDHSEDCACISLHERINTANGSEYVLTVERGTDDLQAILMDGIVGSEVAAVVDRDGHFIARSIAYNEKVGTPATLYVREAIGRGARIYPGVTYEGLKNRTAFQISPLTGWSTHIAIPSLRFEILDASSVGFTVLAGLIALIFAGVFVWLAIKNVRTERVLNERRLQSQKLEAVGQLAGGIAHDFNNMLAVVISALTLMQRRVERGDYDVSKYIEGALDGAKRAAALTQRLLAFSRQQPVAPKAINPNHLISTMIELLSRTLGEQTNVEAVLAQELWLINVDPAQFESALLNLAVNARDAMPNGGRLTIETANISANAQYAKEAQIAPGDYVLISVRDNGVGMDAKTLSRAFDPFFTTKEVGRGTGLGLSQVLGFVQQAAGDIKISSEMGKGTDVRLYLPRHSGPIDGTPKTVLSAPKGAREHVVLVVEDEERVRNYSAEGLRELGYSVIEASNGREALAILESRDDVSLLFTDVVMPEMGGRQLAKIATEKRPSLKVLFTTGYSPVAEGQADDFTKGDDVLLKPFTLDQLAEKARSALAL